MLDGMTCSPTQKLTEIVERILVNNGIVRPVGTHDSLTEIGLTSVDMVNLMLAVEAEFDLSIPQAAIAPGNFRSIATINALIARLVPASAAA
jgi:acyl carrier protein